MCQEYNTLKQQPMTAKGNLFSKMARTIMLAAKSGPDPDMNFKLRFEIDKARAVSMPKENIERAIAKATTEAANLDEVVYEGFGPGGVNVIVEAATDNKNRTAQEIKNAFDRAGGSLAGPGAVKHNFIQKGLLLIKKSEDPESQMLSLIDMGVEDVIDTEDGIEVYVAPEKLSEIHKKLSSGYEVTEAELIMKPVNFVELTNTEKDKATDFLETMEDLDDVQRVFSNLNV